MLKVEGFLPSHKVVSLREKGFEVYKTKVNTFVSMIRPCDKYAIPNELAGRAFMLVISSEAIADYGFANTVSGLTGKTVPPNEVGKKPAGVIARFTTLVSAVTIDAYGYKGRGHEVLITKYLARIKQGYVCLERETLFRGQYNDLLAKKLGQFAPQVRFAIQCEIAMEESYKRETGQEYSPQLAVGDIAKIPMAA